jgi:hypothetical protein
MTRLERGGQAGGSDTRRRLAQQGAVGQLVRPAVAVWMRARNMSAVM